MQNILSWFLPYLLCDLSLAESTNRLPEFITKPEGYQRSGSYFIREKTGEASALLECAGINTETIQWKCNGKTVPSSWYENENFKDDKDQSVTTSTLTVKKQRVEEFFGMEDYWCLCVLKNSYTTEKSKRAYIKIAYLDSKFQKPYPQSGGVEFGVEFLLDCKPPRGVPEPTITWFKDGQRIFIDKKKYEMTEHGDLIVMNVDKYAAGNYTCRATNMAGSRDTPPAIVWVYANGGWSDWSSWSRCEVRDGNCGEGTKERRRECNNPEPISGKNCRGAARKEEYCNVACTNFPHIFNSRNTQPTQDIYDDQKDSNLIMIACLAGAAGIALVIFVVIFIYLKSKNNFNYLKKTESQKKAPFNANHDFDLIRTQSQVDARTNRKDGTLERLLYRHDSHTPTNPSGVGVYKPAYNPVYKDEYGTRSSSGISCPSDPSDGNNCGGRIVTNQNLSSHGMPNPADQPIYHSIVPTMTPSHVSPTHVPPTVPPTQNYNYNSNYPTYAYPTNPYKPR